MDQDIKGIVTDLVALPVVDAILLGGSRASGTADAGSDYDIYVYAESEIPAEQRRPILDRHLKPGFELDNRFWETEDNGHLAPSGIPIDILYRSLSWIDGHLTNLLDRHVASAGYTTCLWRNIRDSQVLFDRDGAAARLKGKADCPYPPGLAKAIVAKNKPLLAGTIPCYRDQIAKAAGRGDLVSVNHRVAAWLESYFDILFAINQIPHPGEKRIVEFLGREASRLPERWREDINALLQMIPDRAAEIPAHIDRMVVRLDRSIPE